jgi:uncharacterized protein (TIGR02246 family)
MRPNTVAGELPMSNEGLKQELQQINAAYAAGFNNQDPAGIAALFVSGGVHVNETGSVADIEEFYKTAFKRGSTSRMEASVDEVWSLGTDVATAVGRAVITGRDQSGATVERHRRTTATYVREGGKWKLQMLTALPRA